MKIAIATDFFTPWAGGPATFVENFLAYLAGTPHQVTVLAPSATGVPSVEARGNITIRRMPTLPFPAGYGLRVTVQLDAVRDALLADAPDVLQAHHPFPLSYAAIRAARAAGIPVVAVNHTIPECALYGMRDRPFLYPVARHAFNAYLTWLLRQATAVCTPTATAAALLRAMGYRRPIAVISNGIDTARFVPGADTSSLVGNMCDLNQSRSFIAPTGAAPAHETAASSVGAAAPVRCHNIAMAGSILSQPLTGASSGRSVAAGLNEQSDPSVLHAPDPSLRPQPASSLPSDRSPLWRPRAPYPGMKRGHRPPAPQCPDAAMTSQCQAVVQTSRRPPPSKQSARAALGLPDRPLVLSAGRLDAEKDMPTWLRAAALAAAQSDAHFVIGGQGADRPRLERLAVDLGIAERVTFLGFVPAGRLPLLYQAADLYCITGAVELQSITTLEAMAGGLPVVAARAAALPELVEDGVTGYLAPVGDHGAFARAILALLRDPASAAAMGLAGRRAAEAHALPGVCAQHEALLVQAATSRTPRPIIRYTANYADVRQ